MLKRLRNVGVRLRNSLWFIPTLSFLGSVAAACGLIWLDRHTAISRWLGIAFPADGARALLQAIAASMITVAALVFSLTLAVMSQTGAQYSPRVVRNFVRDRANQAVLGAFVSIYAYCLVVLLAVDGERPPTLAVTGGVALAFLGIGTLIFFIHHIARSMQVSHILTAIEADTRPVIERLFIEDESGAERRTLPAQADLAVLAGEPDAVIPSRFSGYVQDVDAARLVALAEASDAVFTLAVAPGEHVIAGEVLVEVRRYRGIGQSAEAEIDAAAVAACVGLGQTRNLEQDPAFGLRQVVDVALKALSPGINDTTTAVAALNHLASLVRTAAVRPDPPRWKFRGDRLRVVLRVVGFEFLAKVAFTQIRQCAAGNSAVLSRLAEILGALGEGASNPGRRRCLREMLDLVEAGARASIPVAADARPVLDATRTARRRLAEVSAR